jgi:Cytochrome c554 and c-prime
LSASNDPEPEPDPSPRPPRSPVWKAVALVAALTAVVAVVLRWSYSAPGPSPRAPTQYVGGADCRECHPAQAAAHARSGHARTLFRVEGSPLVGRLDGVTVDDPERPGVTWTYRRQGDALATERREAGAVERFLLEYAFGSGRHATTFVTLTSRDPMDPALIEHRLSLFAHQPLPGVTPGQSLAGKATGNTPAGRHHGRSNTLKCFGCHTTVTSDRGRDVLDLSAMISNVTCERCHGPARDHVAAARAGRPEGDLRMRLGPGRTSPSAELAFCGQCHRLPSMIAAGPASIVPENTTLVRHQPVGLMQSACYNRTGGGLSCSTCHDPHARPSTDTAAYEAVCLSCHGGPEKTACRVDPKGGCIGCHMPLRDTTRGMKFTDHWIRARPLAEAGKIAPVP